MTDIIPVGSYRYQLYKLKYGKVGADEKMRQDAIDDAERNREFQKQCAIEDAQSVIEQSAPSEQTKNQDSGAAGWWDETMNAAQWMKVQNLAPEKAAMLLRRIDPDKNTDPQNENIDGDESAPRKYRDILRIFEDVASVSPMHRTLMQWRTIAQEKNLPYHSWIDEYALSMPDAELQLASTPKAEAVTGTQSAPATGINKLRRNSLDAAIDKAIKIAESMELSPVYLELKEMALNAEKPFITSDKGVLLFTDDEDNVAKLTKDALRKRLETRRNRMITEGSGG